MQGYNISFPVTNSHCEDMHKHTLICFIVQSMEVIFFHLQKPVMNKHFYSAIFMVSVLVSNVKTMLQS